MITSPLVLFILSSLTGLIGYVMKSHLDRIQRIETDLRTKISEEKAEKLIVDKLAPIKDDLEEIKTKMDMILERLINGKTI